MTDNQFETKFNSMRPALLRELRIAHLPDCEPESVLRAYASHLQEISPKHGCPRWQTIQKATGWTYFLKTFISDKKKLDDGIWNTDPSVASMMEFLREQSAARAV